MFSFGRQTDVLATPFDPNNAAHVALAMTELQTFKEARDNLLYEDTILAAGVTCDTFLYAALGIIPAIIGLVALWYAAKPASRLALASDFNAHLDRIMDIYHWMIKDKPASFTHDAAFLNVAEAISPFVKLNQLMLWDPTHTRPDDFSDQYIQLLAQEPHRVQLVMVKNASSVPFFSMFTSEPARIVNEEQQPVGAMVVKKANAICSFFPLATAEAKRAVYGYQPKVKADSMEAPRPVMMQP
jgi:hypothetical protein